MYTAPASDLPGQLDHPLRRRQRPDVVQEQPQPAELTDVSPQTRQRSMMAYFPTGVSVVSAFDSDGCPHGITCSSLTSVCLEPPTVLVSIISRSITLRHALRHGIFGITLLNAQARALAQRFATPALDRFAGVSWRRSPLGAPWIDPGMTAAADCDVADTVEVGDHTVLFGRVRNVTVLGGSPLLYGLRTYQDWRQPEPG
jgi:flavin reductase (DIM6/NTAB) family NADH-FMN oxidoreductase RutF